MRLGVTPWDFKRLDAAGLSAQAARAEGLGYESFWLPENHFNPHAIPEPLMLLAGVAAATRRIRLATTSFLLPVRHPLQAAEQVAVLDQMSGGRVLLGVGRGFAPVMLKAFQVAPKEKREIFERSLTLMRRAWSGEPIDVGGGDTIVLDPLPVQRPHPPIWVAAFGPKALRQAGRLGFPYLASPMEPMATLEANYAVHRDWADTPPSEVPLMRSVYVARDGRDASRVRTALADLPLPRSDEAVPLDDWAIVGEMGFVEEKLAEYSERLGATHLIATRLRLPDFPSDEAVRSLEALATRNDA